MDRRSREFKRLADTHRTTKDDARSEGIGSAEPGIELPARSYLDETGVADLGVDEPTVPTTPPQQPRRDDVTCLTCGGPIRTADVFCPHCGAELVAG